MKKIIILLLVFAALLSSCTQSGESITTTESETEQEILSETCDRVLATGKEENGDIYELVANGTADYDSVSNEIGVIKNNTWLVPLSSEMPLLKDGQLIIPDTSDYGEKYHFTMSILDDKDTVINAYNEKNHTKLSDLNGNLSYCEFRYAGDGCFTYEANAEYEPYNLYQGKTDYQKSQMMMLYNSQNNKGYNLYANENSKIAHSSRPFSYNGVNYIVLENSKTQMIRLNIDEMKPEYISCINGNIMVNKTRETEVYVNDDMIYFRNYSNSKENGFYNIEGERIIDLSEYDIQSYALAFIDGECSFIVKNPSNQNYQITIDKEGKIINQERIE